MAVIHNRPHHRRRLENYVHVLAPALGTHETAPESPYREIATLGPHERLHIQNRLVLTRSNPDRAFYVAPDTAYANAPAEPICFTQRFG
jgi:hypothetical protein